MKILLINPSSKLNIISRKYRRFVSPLPPMGIAYIAAVLQDSGFEVIIEDQFASQISNEQLLDKIKHFNPRVIGFSCLTTAMGNVNILVKAIRKLNKDIKIVLGNIHPSLFADQILKEGLADIVVRGEGEYSMLDVAIALKNKTSLRLVQGISFRENGTILHNPDRKFIEDIERLPYPAWHLFNLCYYTNFPIIALYNETILPIQASRGCPYKCYFCSQDKVYPTPRYRKAKDVVNEIEMLYERFKVRYFGFNDAYFPFSVKYGIEFCDEMIHRNLHKKISWITETRVDKVNAELLKRMKEAGLKLIMYGFEVGNQRILDRINKKTTLEQARKAMEMTKKSRIFTTGLFILGLPGESRQTCLDTISFAKEIDPDIAKFNIAVPFPGSRFFEDYKNKINMNRSEKFTSWYDFSSFSDNIIYTPDGLNSKELVDMQRKAMFEFYVRPVKISRILIKGTFSLKDLLYGFSVLFSNYLKSIFGKFSSEIR